MPLITLIDNGPKKIQVIKAIREATGLGLKEAKDITDKVPTKFKVYTAEAAKKFKQDATAQGAKVRIGTIRPELSISLPEPMNLRLEVLTAKGVGLNRAETARLALHLGLLQLEGKD